MVNKHYEHRKLYVFDFDDTLVKTDALVKITTARGKTFFLSPREFATYNPRPGDVYDFSQFDVLLNPREIKWTCDIMRGVYEKRGAAATAVLTARGHDVPVREFLHSINMIDVEVAAIGTSNPLAKAEWIDHKIKKYDLRHVEFYDDSHKNVSAINELRHHHPDVRIITRHIIHRSPKYKH